MKIKTKLSLVLIVLTFIPLIVVNIIYNNNLSIMIKDEFSSIISREANVKAELLSNYLDTTLKFTETVIEDEDVHSYLDFTNSELYTIDHIVGREFMPLFVSVNKVLNYITVSDSSVVEAFITNNFGDIVAGTDMDYNHIPLEERVFYQTVKGLKNGISSLTTINSEGQQIPVFIIVKDIVSLNDTVIGKYYQINNIYNLQSVLESSRSYGSSSNLIMDNEGNVLDVPYYKVSHYSKIAKYSLVDKYIDDFLENESSDKFISYDYNNMQIVMYNTKIQTTNWNLLVNTEGSEISGFYKRNVWKFRMQTMGVFLVLSIALTVTSIIFSKPIENIVEILKLKQRGENVRFVIDTDDDFAEIGRAFNRMFDEVVDSEQRYRTIVEMTDNIVFEINFKKNSVFISNNFNQKFSFRPKSDNFQDSFFYKGRIHKDDKDRYRRDFNRIINEDSYLQGEYRFKNIYGDFMWILIRATKFFDRNDCPTKVIGVIVDIDKEKRNELKLLQKASYDALTQLYNRETFLRTLQNEYELSQMRKSRDAVLFIDLDDFKHFNDEYGHACGDEVLKFTANSIKKVIGKRGFAGRFGGDEFVITLINQCYFEEPGEYASHIIDTLSAGFTSESTGKHLAVRCSIGIAFFSESGQSCEEILGLADEAMYTIKKHGKSNFGYFTEDDGSIPHKHQKTEQ